MVFKLYFISNEFWNEFNSIDHFPEKFGSFKVILIILTKKLHEKYLFYGRINIYL